MASKKPCVSTLARSSNTPGTRTTVANVCASTIDSRRYGARRALVVEASVVGYQAKTSTSRAVPGVANDSVRLGSVTCHEVVPTTNEPVGASSLNLGGAIDSEDAPVSTFSARTATTNPRLNLGFLSCGRMFIELMRGRLGRAISTKTRYQAEAFIRASTARRGLASRPRGKRFVTRPNRLYAGWSSM